jgi:imidazolonepropionase-like amidohydrolase
MKTSRSFAALLAGMLLLTVSAVSQAQTPASDQAVVLRGARVIDGTAGNPIDNAAVVIREGRILAIGPAASITVPPGATVIDYSGKTIIPGLISTHSHVGIFAGVKSAPENYNRNFILQQLRQVCSGKLQS